MTSPFSSPQSKIPKASEVMEEIKTEGDKISSLYWQSTCPEAWISHAKEVMINTEFDINKCKTFNVELCCDRYPLPQAFKYRYIYPSARELEISLAETLIHELTVLE